MHFYMSGICVALDRGVDLEEIMHTARAFLASFLLAAPALAGGPGMRFDVPEPFQVGRHHNGAGTVSLRNVGVTTTPVALIEIWVDGTCVGAIQATRRIDAVVAARDEALFRRDDEGGLVMVGFRVAGDRDGSFQFVPDAGLIPAGSTLAEARIPTSHP
jgi:hypothetical protein